MSTPEVIYLIAGEYDGEQGTVWCDCAAPDSYCDPDDAVKYVRADIHESTTTELQEEIGHLEDSLIKQGQILREIVNITKGPPVDKMHSTHDAVESVERLQARVAMLELESSDVVMCLSELMRGLEIPAGPMFNDPVSMNMIGKAIAAQAKEAAKAGGDYE